MIESDVIREQLYVRLMNFLTSQYEFKIVGRIGLEAVRCYLARADREVRYVSRLALAVADLDDSRASVGEINAN